MVLLQLLTEQGPLGLLSAVKEALDGNTLTNLVPRLPANAVMQAWSQSFAQLALRCTQPGALLDIEQELLPALEELASKLGAGGSSAMSWEQVEEMLMLPLQVRLLFFSWGRATDQDAWLRLMRLSIHTVHSRSYMPDG